MKKYELTKETKTLADGTVLHRIRALLDIPRHGVKAGDLGGLIEKENNLSQDGDAWIFDDACVYGDARVYDNTEVSGNACVFGNAEVYGNATVYGNACVSGDAYIFGNAYIFGDAKVYGNAKVSGDAKVSGKCYEAIVHAVETIEAAKAEAKGESNGSK